MDKSNWGLAASVLVLVACAGTGGSTMRGGGPKQHDIEIADFIAPFVPTDCEVNVHVVDGTDILVDQEPVRNKKCGTDRTITFKVIGPYKFAPTNGIQVKATSLPMPVCGAVNPKKIECRFARPASVPQGDRYPYTVNVVKNDGTAVGSLDPMMINF